jgi:molybdate transport system substrate-binding protein
MRRRGAVMLHARGHALLITRSIGGVACLAAAILIALPAASGAELQVPVSIAMRGAVAEVADKFEKQTGHTVKIIAAAPAQIVASLKGGAPADVVVQIDSVLPEMEEKGLIRRERVALGTTGFGIATRTGDPAPDIATPDALKTVLLGAAKVIYNDPAVTPSGKLLLTIAERLGVAEQVKGKSQVVAAGANVSTLAKAPGDGPVIALAVLVEISGHPGAKPIGPLPKELQVPLPYSAVLGSNPRDQDAAEAFLRALATPEAKQAYAKAGFEVKQ